MIYKNKNGLEYGVGPDTMVLDLENYEILSHDEQRMIDEIMEDISEYEENRKKFLALPNFDAEIFKEITGIDVNKKSCVGKVVEIDGKKYRLEEV